MDITLKNLPEEVHQELKRAAKEQGRSLNAQAIQVLTAAAEENARRRRIRQGRASLERFVSSLPRTNESVKWIREDRKR